MVEGWAVSEATLDARIDEFRAEIALQEQVIELLANSLEEPIHYYSGLEHHGFRFAQPGPKHFCLLKAVRSVSALHAILTLLKAGFTQEISVLIRTVIECTTHLEYVLAGYDGKQMHEPQRGYVEEYFADFRRNEVSDFLKPRVRQQKVHKTIGALLDHHVPRSEREGKLKDVAASELMSDGYLSYSNFVHSRYPEVMDLYGGEPGRFHLRGMRGTPKDCENLETVSGFVVAVSNALRYMVLGFGLRGELKRYPKLTSWFHFEVDKAS